MIGDGRPARVKRAARPATAKCLRINDIAALLRRPEWTRPGHSAAGRIPLHVSRRGDVISIVKVFAGIVSLLAAALAGAAEFDLAKSLKAIEARYNSVRTLELDFEQTYTAPNKARRTESGRLFLRKPGRMRWEYAKPAGKLFVSDGSDYWYFNPLANRAEKMKLKEATDMQAPLAFLIGKLDFSRDFGKFTVSHEGGLARITAEPRNVTKAPYREVTFAITADARIETLRVTGQDASTMDFRFRNELRNPVQKEAALYTFTPPAGVEVVTP